TIGTAQNDIKKVLAYSTVSQLGYMFLAAGVGAYAMAIFHLATHAFFKACLFLGSGSVIHGMSGEQDMRKMGGLWKKQPITFVTFFAATLAITGFPLTAGFLSKDAILWSAFSADGGAFAPVFAGIAKTLWLVGLLAAGLTAFYMWRLVFMTFFSGELRADHHVAKHVHESPWTMTLPLVVLGVLSLVGGVLGWPHVLGGHDWIAEWLAPSVGMGTGVEGEHVAIEWILMATATTVAVAGFLTAYILYARGIHAFTARFATQQPGKWLYERVLGKWHVDELYDVTVVQPILWTSREVLDGVVDKRVIDGSVNAVGWLARSLGFFGQLFQSGNVQRYLAIFAIGLAVLLYGWMSPFENRPASVTQVVRGGQP
ncbi:MAG: proton-conducting transporter membrane subunit, partial [Myxococcota bacterium]